MNYTTETQKVGERVPEFQPLRFKPPEDHPFGGSDFWQEAGRRLLRETKDRDGIGIDANIEAWFRRPMPHSERLDGHYFEIVVDEDFFKRDQTSAGFEP